MNEGECTTVRLYIQIYTSVDIHRYFMESYNGMAWYGIAYYIIKLSKWEARHNMIVSTNESMFGNWWEKAHTSKSTQYYGRISTNSYHTEKNLSEGKSTTNIRSSD